MKDGEPSDLAAKSAFRCARAGAAAGLLVTVGLLALPLDAAVNGQNAIQGTSLPVFDRNFRAVVAIDDGDTLENAVAHPIVVAQDAPYEPRAGADAPAAGEGPHDGNETPWPTRELGLLDRVQDWLARANRQFQTVIVRRLSVGTEGGEVDVTRHVPDVKTEDEEAARRRAEDAQAKEAAEAKHRQEIAEAERNADEEARRKLAAERKERDRLEAEAKRLEEERGLAEEKRKAEAQRQADEAKAAEDAAAREAAANAQAERDAQAAREAAREHELTEKAAEDRRKREEEDHQRALADAAAKAAEDAKRIAAEQEAARAAKAAQEKAAQEALQQEAAEKQRLAEEKAAKAQAAREARERERQEAAAKAEAERRRVAEEEAAKAAAEKQRLADEEAAKAAAEKAQRDAAAKEAADRQRIAEAETAKTPAAKETEEKTKAAAPSPPPTQSKEHAAHSRRHEAKFVREARNTHLAHGPVVKRWVRRLRHGQCRYAGQKISLPGRYVVARGDSLWRIALRHYRSGLYFMRIYRANRDLIRNANLIHPCQRLYLPRKRG
jgi:colicin import membrane protein